MPKSAKESIKKAQDNTGNVIDKYFSEEDLKACNGYLGTIPGTVTYFVPDVIKEKLPKDKWPVFKYRSMNNEDSIALLDYFDENDIVNSNDLSKDIKDIKEKLSKSKGIFLKTYRLAYFVVSRCLEGWNNFRDVNGNEIQFKKSGVTVDKSTMDCMPSALIKNLYNAIMDNKSLSDTEVTGLEF